MYVAYHRQRQARDRLWQQQRYQRGWQQARLAAQLLKSHYQVGKVFLFGSLLSPDTFDATSDIDLAVENLPLERYCDAVGTLLLKVEGFDVDLVRLETAQNSLKEHILQEGVEL